MKIKKVTLNNFRIYKGINSVSFNTKSDKNISIIAGKNGYGKTTFLTSLIWVFYGKMMSEVEDKYRKDIKNSGGYEQFLLSLMNRDNNTVGEQLKVENRSFSVEIELNDLSIPSIPCDSVIIKRSFDLKLKKEELSILIDGIENELTKEVGYEVFINDFILPREIAKFFFFDAEKIVSLAEAKTKEELRNLSSAYSEVLGIKKYEDLRKNLETLISKLKRSGATKEEYSKIDNLSSAIFESTELIELNQDKLTTIEIEIQSLKTRSEGMQEKLIREGNEITLEELQELKSEQIKLKSFSQEIRGKLKKLMDLVPFVIAGPALKNLHSQLIQEQTQSSLVENNSKIIDEILKFADNISKVVDVEIEESKTRKKIQEALKKEALLKKTELSKKYSNGAIICDFSQEQFRNFEAIINNIKGSFSNQFSAVSQEEKTNRILITRFTQKIKQAEARKGNPLALKLREEKLLIDDRIEFLLTEKGQLQIEIENQNQNISSKKKVLSELEKKLNVAETDSKKYTVAHETLQKVNEIIVKIKEDKKYSLQKSILFGLKKLMHKIEFIENVNVKIKDDVMDIDLIDKNEMVIDKNSLSKGEQQLYATALLKALVDESGIKFPVFIDSPLQKFDKQHSKSIIEEFYPMISEQVVLLPLLEKELSKTEFDLLKSNLNSVYLLESTKNHTTFIPIEENYLFEIQKLEGNVHTN